MAHYSLIRCPFDDTIQITCSPISFFRLSINTRYASSTPDRVIGLRMLCAIQLRHSPTNPHGK